MVGGVYGLLQGNEPVTKTELVSLLGEETQIPDCLANLADHPNEFYSSAGGALPDSGIICHTLIHT